MITVEQIRAARIMLNLKQKELAHLSGISVATLNNIERGAQTDPKMSTMRAIRQALELRGIEFTSDSLGGIGVFYKPRHMQDHSTILIVDDNKADRTLYSKWLQSIEDKEYNIVQAGTARDGFDAFVESQPDCLILDFMLYGADGFQLLAALKRDHRTLPPIIFVTGMHNDLLEESAKSAGVYCYLNKSHMNKGDLCDAVANALAHSA